MAAANMTCSMHKVVNTPTVRPRCSSNAVQMHSRRAPTQASATLASSFTSGTSSSFRGSVSAFQTASRPTSAQQPIRDVTTCAAKVTGMIKLALDAGKANPSPPVGPALGAKGVNIMAFCKEYNAATQDKMGTVIPVEITVFEDKSFKFILKTPPAGILLKKYAGIDKGSADGVNSVVGSVTEAQLREIAEIKMPDLNANDIDAAMKIVGGQAKNMGITIEG